MLCILNKMSSKQIIFVICFQYLGCIAGCTKLVYDFIYEKRGDWLKERREELKALDKRDSLCEPLRARRDFLRWPVSFREQ